MRAGVVLADVVRVAGGDHRLTALAGERRQMAVDRLLDGEARVLDLDVDVLGTEDLHEVVELAARRHGVVPLEVPADRPRQAPREGDDAVRVARHQLLVDPRLAVVPLQVAGRAELDQVVVALGALGQQRQVRPSLLARALGAIRHDVRLEAHDRRDAALARPPVELDRAGHDPVVGQRGGGLAELLDAIEQARDLARPVEDRVVGVDVQVTERWRGAAHGLRRLAEAIGRDKAPPPHGACIDRS